MTRRKSLLTVPAAAAASMPAAAKPRSILELRYFQMRNSADGQMQRAGDFIRDSYMPALERAGGKVYGVFANLIAPDGPFLYMLSSFPGLGAMETALDKLNADTKYQKERSALYAKTGLAYQRMESDLFRAFATMPDVEVPPVEAGKPSRIFELRTYESNSPATLQKKIAMFETGGETAIFRRVGLTPVFFAEAISGRRMPNLTYMLVYDSLAAREKNWAAFVSDPAWLKLRATPGLSDAEIVSNISNILLRPLPFSPVR
ncbi:MAG: NIPSNAP family protein [Bryobacterales bacterium]|nr:NIPSNAP family protein [Bryobacterales bacterium]